MKKTVEYYDFEKALKSDEYANWSIDAIKRLWDYYEDLEADTGTEIELDVVAMRCDWDEFASLEEAAEEYGVKPEYLKNNTDVLLCDNGHVLILAY